MYVGYAYLQGLYCFRPLLKLGLGGGKYRYLEELLQLILCKFKAFSKLESTLVACE
jgi:hypothetical protein